MLISVESDIVNNMMWSSTVLLMTFGYFCYRLYSKYMDRETSERKINLMADIFAENKSMFMDLGYCCYTMLDTLQSNIYNYYKMTTIGNMVLSFLSRLCTSFTGIFKKYCDTWTATGNPAFFDAPCTSCDFNGYYDCVPPSRTVNCPAPNNNNGNFPTACQTNSFARDLPRPIPIRPCPVMSTQSSTVTSRIASPIPRQFGSSCRGSAQATPTGRKVGSSCIDSARASPLPRNFGSSCTGSARASPLPRQFGSTCRVGQYRPNSTFTCDKNGAPVSPQTCQPFSAPKPENCFGGQYCPNPFRNLNNETTDTVQKYLNTLKTFAPMVSECLQSYVTSTVDKCFTDYDKCNESSDKCNESSDKCNESSDKCNESCDKSDNVNSGNESKLDTTIKDFLEVATTFDTTSGSNLNMQNMSFSEALSTVNNLASKLGFELNHNGLNIFDVSKFTSPNQDVADLIRLICYLSCNANKFNKLSNYCEPCDTESFAEPSVEPPSTETCYPCDPCQPVCNEWPESDSNPSVLIKNSDWTEACNEWTEACFDKTETETKTENSENSSNTCSDNSEDNKL